MTAANALRMQIADLSHGADPVTWDSLLCLAALVSLAAQVAEAEPSVWGWIVAALPALGFLAVVKIVLSRSPAMNGPDQIASMPPEPDPKEHSATRWCQPSPNGFERLAAEVVGLAGGFR